MSSIRRSISHIPEVFRARRVFPAWVRMALHVAHLTNPRFPLNVRLKAGQVLSIVDREELSVLWEIHVGRCYDVRVSDQVILDAGGNIGMFALFAAAAAPQARIICFEPFPASYGRLVDHLSRNGLRERVEPINCALAAVDGERQMIWGGSVPGPRRKLLLHGSGEGNADLVRTRSLASLFTDLKLESVDFFKMDIEGAEYETLLAAPPELFRRVGRFNVEIHEVHQDLHFTPEQLFAHLDRGGHRLVAWEPDAFGTGVARFERRA